MHENNHLTNTLNTVRVCKALRDKDAVDFTKSIILKHYQHFFDKEVAESMLDATFATLSEGQSNGINIINLKSDIKELAEKFFNENSDWFFSKYSEYKTKLKPNYYFSKVESEIEGKKVLDFGCGKGFMASYLHEKNFNVVAADVVDYREIEHTHIPFVKINEIHDVSKIFDVDTTLVITVLHHISNENLRSTLENLSKITKKLIIIEDVVDVYQLKNSEMISNNFTEEETKLVNLNEESKKNTIILMDFYGNIIIQGLTQINLPFEFKKTNEWSKILQECGFSDVKITPIGFPDISFHGYYQVMISCSTK